MSNIKFLREGLYMDTQIFIQIIKKRVKMNAWIYKEAQFDLQRCVRALNTYKYDKYHCKPLNLDSVKFV